MSHRVGGTRLRPGQVASLLQVQQSLTTIHTQIHTCGQFRITFHVLDCGRKLIKLSWKQCESVTSTDPTSLLICKILITDARVIKSVHTVTL